MTPLRRRLIEELKLRNYSPHTRRAYVRAVAGLAEHFGKSPEVLGQSEIRRYFIYLFEESCVSARYIEQIYWGLRFFYQYVLGKSELLDQIACPKVGKTLPVIPSQEEVREFFQAVRSVKYRAMFMVAYEGGLRASEIAHLRVEDVDSQKIRHYGFLANRYRQEKLALCRTLLGVEPTAEGPPGENPTSPCDSEADQVTTCPKCGKGRLLVVEQLAAEREQAYPCHAASRSPPVMNIA